MKRRILGAVYLLWLLSALSASAAAAENFSFEATRSISIDLQDSDWSNFLRIISDVSDYNIVMLEPFQIKLTKRLTNQPWGVILRDQAAEHGFSLDVNGRVIALFRPARPLAEAGKNYSGKRISIDFQDTDGVNARQVIELTAGEQSPLPNEERCKVTLFLVDTPWDQVYDLVREFCARQE